MKLEELKRLREEKFLAHKKKKREYYLKKKEVKKVYDYEEELNNENFSLKIKEIIKAQKNYLDNRKDIIISKLNDYKKIFLQTSKIFLPLSLVVIGIGMIGKFLVFDPKLPSFNITSLWLIKILFLTIFPEEFFFRFFLQNNIINLLKKSQFFKTKNYQIIGLILTAIIFGLTHFSGGFSLVLLAIISGFGYGFVYMRTRYIESAILLHFLINLSHFLFFSYPFNLAIS